MPTIIGIIPARYASTRFPGKPLIDIAGLSMINRVYLQATQCKALQKVVVATDDERIYRHVLDFGAEVIMTHSDLPSGTDRCFDAFAQLGEEYDYIVNVQGDEPLIDPSQISALCSVLDGNVQLATLVSACNDEKTLQDINSVKVVLNQKSEALYFSRACIPAQKNTSEPQWVDKYPYRLHVGLYAYRSDVLRAITKLPVSPLEEVESLEQLRWLDHGYSIKCVLTHEASPSIDTEADLQAVLRVLKA